MYVRLELLTLSWDPLAEGGCGPLDPSELPTGIHDLLTVHGPENNDGTAHSVVVALGSGPADVRRMLVENCDAIVTVRDAYLGVSVRWVPVETA